MLFISFLFLRLSLSLLFFVKSKNLLLALILLEFISLCVFCSYFVRLNFCSSTREVVGIRLFTIMVVEGVLSVTGLLSVIFTSGSDYCANSSLINF